MAAAARRAAAAEAAAERAAREGREADARGAERLDGLRRRLADAEAAAARARAAHVAELANLKSSLKELEARAPPVFCTVSPPPLRPRIERIERTELAPRRRLPRRSTLMLGERPAATQLSAALGRRCCCARASSLQGSGGVSMSSSSGI